MKARLVVMNKQRIVQVQQENEWVNERIQRAGENVKPGIYNLFQARELDYDTVGSGVIIHTDRECAYQLQPDGSILKYNLEFAERPFKVGETRSIHRDKNGKFEFV